jgi:hypothetical protein
MAKEIRDWLREIGTVAFLWDREVLFGSLQETEQVASDSSQMFRNRGCPSEQPKNVRPQVLTQYHRSKSQMDQ